MTTITTTQEVAEQFTGSSLLVSIHIGAYQPRKLDRQETAKVENEHGTKRGVVYVSKDTLPSSGLFDNIETLQGRARNLVKKFTVPFAHGVGLLPATKYLELMAELRPIFAELETLYRQVPQEYAVIKEIAKRDLTTLYKESDYPSVSEIESKFYHSLEVLPIASPENLRLTSVFGDVAEAIQQRVNETFNEKISSVAPYIKSVLLKPLIKASASLQNPDRSFKDSLIENIVEVAKEAETLNVLNDAEVAESIYKMRAFDRFNCAELRDKKSGARAHYTQVINTLIEELGGEIPEPEASTIRKPRTSKTPSASDFVALQPCPHAEVKPLRDEPLRGTAIHEAVLAEITDEQLHEVADAAPEIVPVPDKQTDEVNPDDIFAKLGL